MAIYADEKRAYSNEVRDMEPESSLEDRLRRALSHAVGAIQALDGMHGPAAPDKPSIGPAGVFTLAIELEKVTDALEQRCSELARRIGALGAM